MQTRRLCLQRPTLHGTTDGQSMPSPVKRCRCRQANLSCMKLENYIRFFAGTFILTSLLLARWHSPYWLWFTAFVGFNLLQSSLTGFCPLERVLKKLGVDKARTTGAS